MFVWCVGEDTLKANVWMIKKQDFEGKSVSSVGDGQQDHVKLANIPLVLVVWLWELVSESRHYQQWAVIAFSWVRQDSIIQSVSQRSLFYQFSLLPALNSIIKLKTVKNQKIL